MIVENSSVLFDSCLTRQSEVDLEVLWYKSIHVDSTVLVGYMNIVVKQGTFMKYVKHGTWFVSSYICLNWIEKSLGKRSQTRLHGSRTPENWF